MSVAETHPQRDFIYLAPFPSNGVRLRETFCDSRRIDGGYVWMLALQRRLSLTCWQRLRFRKSRCAKKVVSILLNSSR